MFKNKKNQIICISIFVIMAIISISIYLFLKNKPNNLENTDIINIQEYTNQSEENENNIIKNQKNKICIYITGEVVNPGVYSLEENSRINDAISIAGGLTQKADITRVNLVYQIQDGQKIYIPTKDKNNNSNYIQNNIVNNEKNSKDDIKIITSNCENNIIISDENCENNANKKVNINTAAQTELETLTGVGPSIAAKIIEYRKINGKFNSIDEIKKVSGIGENKYKKIINEISIK